MADFTSLLSNTAVNGAYRASQEIKGDAVAPQAEETGVSFADLVAEAGTDTLHTMRSAEATAQAGLTGQIDTQQVVEATLELESTVRVAVTVRDKLVEAYQEIMRMPV
ncbi:flagellar hook-basal body complex protein FliE [Pseudooceanicola aestuarii]|uniref:flagellar hook-basal body complex protein FliE n=1 Tax=Pseudooceanicola aestuarii TaxID=2697319 RepID=UPI0013D3B1BF|nr:flagellar hook-basal body complex protein FliE [Pseudooceanicola aestuarii]